ncbi:unnamed protein product [Sphagnum tenellum]
MATTGNWSWKYGSSSLSWILLLLLGLLLIASSSSAQVPFGAQVPAYGKPSLDKPTSLLQLCLATSFFFFCCCCLENKLLAYCRNHPLAGNAAALRSSIFSSSSSLPKEEKAFELQALVSHVSEQLQSLRED